MKDECFLLKVVESMTARYEQGYILLCFPLGQCKIQCKHKKGTKKKRKVKKKIAEN